MDNQMFAQKRGKWMVCHYKKKVIVFSIVQFIGISIHHILQLKLTWPWYLSKAGRQNKKKAFFRNIFHTWLLLSVSWSKVSGCFSNSDSNYLTQSPIPWRIPDSSGSTLLCSSLPPVPRSLSAARNGGTTLRELGCRLHIGSQLRPRSKNEYPWPHRSQGDSGSS